MNKYYVLIKKFYVFWSGEHTEPMKSFDGQIITFDSIDEAKQFFLDGKTACGMNNLKYERVTRQCFEEAGSYTLSFRKSKYFYRDDRKKFKYASVL